MKTPNLFNYATSELSQDAFLLWLLDWANPDYKDADEQLNAAAQEFVRFLLDKNKNDLQIESVKCYKQKFHIDVLAVVNNKYALIIEDKTDTKEHDKQIETYTKVLKKDDNFKELEQSCIYYKSGNESRHSIGKLRKRGIKTILRKDVLNLFSPYVDKIKDSIFVDYFNHLQKIENLTNSYQTEPANKWKEEAWQGFYMELEDKLGIGNWGVDFYNEGFRLPLCHISKDEKQIQLYLYLDNFRNLCIKAKCKAKCELEKDYWEDIIKMIKEKMIKEGLHEYLKSIDLKTYDISVSDGKDIKLCDIKRFQNNKRSMFIHKNLSYVEQRNIIVPQLRELQRQLADKIK